MSVEIIIGDALTELRKLPSESVDCCVTSPPYWGLRDYGVEGQLGMERTLGEHLAAMVGIFEEVRRVLKPHGTCWINYGDCYATKPNGRSAADTKAAGTDDRTFRDKPFSTVGPIYARVHDPARRGTHSTLTGAPPPDTPGRIMAGGTLKPKDLCMIPNRLAIALQDAGWWVRSEIVWGKPNPMPDSSGRYRPSTAHEKIWLLTKSAKSFYDDAAVAMPAVSDHPSGNGFVRDARVSYAGRGNPEQWQPTETRLLRNYEPDLSEIVPPQVWRIATASFSEAHFATFPPALVTPCILAGCPADGVVLDPFGGAGTTGLVAEQLKRDSVLIELNPEYAEMARARIRADLGRVVCDLPEKRKAGAPLLDAMEAA